MTKATKFQAACSFAAATTNYRSDLPAASGYFHCRRQQFLVATDTLPLLLWNTICVDILEHAGKWADPGDAGASYIEHLATRDLSVGTYSLRAGAIDEQSPHTEDEVYVVTAGRAQFTSGGQTVDVEPGTVLFVPANEEHRFHDITQALVLLVLFGPAYGTRASA